VEGGDQIMASIDERIVSMKFDNRSFEAGVSQTMASLSKLSASLAQVGSVTGFSNIDKAAASVTLSAPMSALDKLKARLGGVGSNSADGFSAIERAGSRVTLLNPMTALDKLKARLGGIGSNAQTGFADIERASGQVNLSGIASATASASSGFSVLAGAAAVALGGIATKAAAAGAGMVKSLSFGPIVQGFEEYATNLNSIQTILANTKASGADLQDVNSALEELNRYSDQTIYNFSEMAKNIGTFTAAGVDLETATGSIKGIANLAALSGSNSQQASTAMYQLSQAISSGRVSLQDWNSVVNAGMGGTVFQRALATTAENMGTLDKGAVSLTGKMKNVSIEGQSFRESITAKPGEESWLTSDVLTSTLQQFTGDLSNAELAAQGFTAAQIKDIQTMAKTAKEAATQIKTAKQLYEVIQESIGSGWAKTFQIIFGDFEEAKKTFTELGTYLTGFVGKNADARNKVLADWKALGGRTDLIEGIKNVWKGLLTVLKPIKDAFREIFPKKTGAELASLTKRFRDFSATLKLGPEKAKDLKRTFAGLFAVFHIGVVIVGKIIKMFASLLGAAGKGSGGILNFTGSIGDFLVSIDKALTEGGLLTAFFKGLTAILKAPIQVLGALANAIFGLFDGGSGGKADKFGKSMSGLKDTLSPVEKVLNSFGRAWEKLKDITSTAMEEVGKALGKFGDILSNAFSGDNFNKTISLLQTGLIASIAMSFKKALGGGGGVDFGGGMFASIGDTFRVLTSNLMAMQQNLQASTLMKIAIAVGVLAAGILALSLIKPAALAKAMTAVAIGLGQLVGVMFLLSKVAGTGAFITLPIMATGLIALAVAVTILAGAVTIFSKLSWEELIKGLAGVGGVLAAVAAGTRLIGPSIGIAALQLIPMAIAMNLLAVAVRQFATLSWEELVKGLAGVAGTLVAVGLAMTLMPPSMLVIGAGLLGVAIAMNLLAGAVLAFGSMDLLTLGKGILGIAAALVAIGLAIGFIPPTVAFQAAGLLLLSVALTTMAAAIGLMGSLGILTLVQGIAALGAVLVVLGLGLKGMSGTLVGSAALLAAAAALAVIAPVLGFLGSLEIQTIVIGLAAIAGILGVLALAGTLASAPLLALGIALLPLGVLMAATAASFYLFAQALKIIGAEGTASAGVVIAAMTAFVVALPAMIITFVKGLVQIIAQIAVVAPQIVTSLAAIITSMVAVFVKAAPALLIAIGTLIGLFATAVIQNAPKIIQAGFVLLVSFLSGLANNIGKVTSLAIKIVLRFLTALTQDTGKLITAGAKFLVAFLGGIARNIGKVVAAAGNLIVKFLTAIAGQISKVIGAGVKVLIAFVSGIVRGFGDVVKNGIKLVGELMVGIGRAIPKLIKQAVDVAGKVVKAIATGLVKLVRVGFEAIIDFMNGLARVIREEAPRARKAGANLAGAIISGMTFGLSDKVPGLFRKIREIISKIPAGVRKLLGIRSPSSVFIEIGRQTMAGFSQGIVDGSSGSERAMEASGNQVVTMAKKTMSNLGGILDGVMDLDPVISPVLDLSAVHKEAEKLAYISDISPVVAAASLDQASAISQEKTASDTAQAAEAVQAGPSFNFEQNNYSPEALSEIEIYRRTHNQLSQVKSAIGLV
jgi:tape measure domain-containing protein